MRLLITAAVLLTSTKARNPPQSVLVEAKGAAATELLTDLSTVSEYWGELRPYSDNAADCFSVQDAGVPPGCQLEQVHLLQRHANRFPTGADDDGGNNERFAQKVTDFISAQKGIFTGPLDFLNTYNYEMRRNYLTGLGDTVNASVGQLAYNNSFPNGTARPRPVLRLTSMSRIVDSEINWSLGFFGPSFEAVPNPTLTNASTPFNLIIIPEGGTENNTPASYDSCFNDNDPVIGYLGDADLFTYSEVPSRRHRQITASICAYEISYLGQSDFCFLFTQEEWKGFEYTLDIQYYYDQSFGCPTDPAQAVGYLQELIARLKGELITSSNSSVNSTYDGNSDLFPLGQPFYADFSHDTTIVSVLTALFLDYIHDTPNLTEVPPNPNRTFILSHLTPFGANLVTEVIGCASSDPIPDANARTQYYPTQYGYDPTNAPNKFIRMRLNHFILPLDTIRGGACEGRSDGMCAMDSFLQSQADAYSMSNYDFACFGNYTLADPTSGEDYDGAISA